MVAKRRQWKDAKTAADSRLTVAPDAEPERGPEGLWTIRGVPSGLWLTRESAAAGLDGIRTAQREDGP